MMNACNVNEVTIEDLGFAQRTYNCLRRGKIFTLGQIATMTQKDLLKVRNLGMKSVKEIVAKLGEYGLSLREEIDLDAEYEAYCKMEQEGRFDADVEAICKGLEEMCEEYASEVEAEAADDADDDFDFETEEEEHFGFCADCRVELKGWREGDSLFLQCPKCHKLWEIRSNCYGTSMSVSCADDSVPTETIFL